MANVLILLGPSHHLHFPATIIIGSDTYNFVSNSGNIAHYNTGSSNGCNSYENYNGIITIGSSVCTYVGGGLTGAAPLPVSLVDFKAELLNRSVSIYWSTASEENNKGFCH